MPHESVKIDDNSSNHYDGLVECLRLVGDLMAPCKDDLGKCDHCQAKIKEYGFTPESWVGYRSFMKQYDPELSYAKIMPKLLMRMPIWHRTENRLLGILDRKTGKFEPSQQPEAPKPVHEEPTMASWVRKNCRFASRPV